jgi:hypothetical protein
MTRPERYRHPVNVVTRRPREAKRHAGLWPGERRDDPVAARMLAADNSMRQCHPQFARLPDFLPVHHVSRCQIGASMASCGGIFHDFTRFTLSCSLV